MSNLPKKINLVAMLIVFIWISFFATIINYNWVIDNTWSFLFISILGTWLLILFLLGGDYRALIFNKTEVPFWIFLLTMIGGIIIVKQPSLAYGYFWCFILPIPILYFFAKIGFQNKYSMLIIRSICIMATLVCLYGIIEFTTKHNFIYKYLMNTRYYEVFVGRRMMSTHVHPAPLGTYLVAILPLSVALLLKEKKMFLKSLAFISTVFIFTSVILTFSRSALLGAFVGIFTLVHLLFKPRKLIVILVYILLIVIIIVLSSLLVRCGYLLFFRYSLQGLSFNRFIYSSKIDRLIGLFRILKEHPFLGLGFGHFRVCFNHYLPDLANICGPDSKVADCMYIAILAETGLFGFSGFMLFIYFLFKRIWQRLRLLPENENRLLLVCFLSGFLGIMCSFLTYDGLYWAAASWLFWTYAGILSSLSGQTPK